MSGIFGIRQFHNPTVTTNQLRLFAQNLKHRGPDGCTLWSHPFIGLGQCMLHSTPESLTERLPFYDNEVGVAITADARIDNRDELTELVGLHQKRSSEMADSQFILAAFNKWGVSSFVKLLGDFSFALWDSRNRRLYCVRDAIGIKPFYYRITKEGFYFASEIKPLALLEQTLPSVNEGMVAEYLAFQFATRDETLFQDIYRLPPAHYLVVDKEKISIHRYWDFPRRTSIFVEEGKDYKARFLELFKQSVSCRMRSHKTVSAELSGGLDSSAIVSVACVNNKETFIQDIQPYSMLFPGLPCDESVYIESVAESSHIRPIYVSGVPSQPSDWGGLVRQSYQLPDMPSLTCTDEMVSSVKGSGSRVILSGIGGDEWFNGSPFNYVDLLRNSKVSHLCQELRCQVQRFGFQSTASRVARLLFWPLLPGLIKGKVCKSRIGDNLSDWLPQSFIQQTDLVERISKTDTRQHFSSLIEAYYYHYLMSDIQGFFLETLDRHRARFGVENRYPFLDRRIIEYSIILPEYLKYNFGRQRCIIRDSLNTILPELITKRDDKAEFSYLFGQIFLGKFFSKNVNEMAISGIGWTDKARYLHSYQNVQSHFMKYPTVPTTKMWITWFVFATDLWYKTIYEQT